jgi:hypothetical protein
MFAKDFGSTFDKQQLAGIYNFQQLRGAKLLSHLYQGVLS